MNKKALDFILICLIFFETICYTYLLQTNLYYSSSVIYFLSGIGICILPFFLFVPDDVSGKKSPIISGMFWLLIVSMLIIFIIPRFKQIPIDYHIADMLPRIKIYATRFLNGQYVYDDVKEIWGGNLPPYFPATWSPFIPSVIWNFDMRWTSLIILLLVLFPVLLLIRLSASHISNLTLAFLLTGMFLLFNFHVQKASEIWTMTYEGLIAAYYLLLCLALISWNPYFIGVSVTLCLLSRFSLTFWIPPFLIFLWWSESFSFMLKAAGVIAVLVLTLFILPFVIGHFDAFANTLNQYRIVSEGFWRSNNIDLGEYNQVGLYKFFNSGQLPLLRTIQLITTILAPIAFLGFAGKYFPKYENKKIIGLCSLKFTLLFFFNFIEMPYHYIFITPTIISYTIGFYYLSLKKIN